MVVYHLHDDCCKVLASMREWREDQRTHFNRRVTSHVRELSITHNFDFSATVCLWRAVIMLNRMSDAVNDDSKFLDPSSAARGARR